MYTEGGEQLQACTSGQVAQDPSTATCYLGAGTGHLSTPRLLLLVCETEHTASLRGLLSELQEVPHISVDVLASE